MRVIYVCDSKTDPPPSILPPPPLHPSYPQNGKLVDVLVRYATGEIDIERGRDVEVEEKVRRDPSSAMHPAQPRPNLNPLVFSPPPAETSP